MMNNKFTVHQSELLPIRFDILDNDIEYCFFCETAKGYVFVYRVYKEISVGYSTE